jgi:hypothetical protein
VIISGAMFSGDSESSVKHIAFLFEAQFRLLFLSLKGLSDPVYLLGELGCYRLKLI